MNYKIPNRLNLSVCLLLLSVLVSHFYFLSIIDFQSWNYLLLVLSFGVFMNSGYAIIHEAFHGILFENKLLNDLFGVLFCTFFPAPFHLVRQGHLGHHIRNRSDDEAFDLYFEDENKYWKGCQYFSILTGFYWMTVVLSNLVVVLIPAFVFKKFDKLFSFDRPSKAFFKAFNPEYGRLIFLEGLMNILVHTLVVILLDLAVIKYAVFLFGFGFMWSAMQYVHHFGTTRDVLKGARNLKTFFLLDKIWLNHNCHLNHHLHPTVPWCYLERLNKDLVGSRGNMFLYYFRMWRGPRKATERIKNHFDGEVIR